MDRRTLMAGASAALIARRAAAQPVPLWGPAGATQTLGPGPLSAVPTPSLALDFMNPGTLDARISFSRASTGTYTDAGGVIRTAVSNAPRWDFANGVLRGLLLEEARTNAAFPSVPDGAWALSAAVITGAAGVAPDGTNALARIAETAASSFHVALAAVPLVASAAYTASVYAKAAENRYLQVILDNGGAVQIYATFDLQVGTISGPLTGAGGSTPGNAIIQAASNGVWRCVISGTLGAFTTGRIMLTLSNVPNPGVLPSYVGNPANGLLVWGAQVEQGAFPTSYIPTTVATVTRAYDLATMPTGSWYNPNAGTLFAELWYAPPSAGIASIDDTTSFEQLQIAGYAGSYASYYGLHAAVLQLQNFTATVPNGVVRVAANYGAPTPWKGVNNGTVLIGVTSGAPLNATRLLIGATGSTPGASVLNSQIRRVQYWPRTLSDTEMQQVTR